MAIKKLERLGFTKNEAKLYLALLEKGMTTITGLVKITHFHKQMVYDNLERLLSKGLVSYVIKAKRRHFSAVNPKRIIQILEEQKQEIENKKKLANSLLPSLVARKGALKEKQTATIFYDLKALKTILEHVLESKEVLIYGAEGRFKENFGIYWKNYVNRLLKKKSKWKIIYNEKLRKKRKTPGFIKLRFIPKEFESPATTMIFQNKVAIILWDKIPFATLIESSKIAKSYKNYFALLWKNAKL